MGQSIKIAPGRALSTSEYSLPAIAGFTQLSLTCPGMGCALLYKGRQISSRADGMT